MFEPLSYCSGLLIQKIASLFRLISGVQPLWSVGGHYPAADLPADLRSGGYPSLDFIQIRPETIFSFLNCSILFLQLVEQKLSMEQLSGKDHYRRLYQNAIDDEAEWLRLGARQKADSVQLLMERNGIVADSLLELGAGTGAVIQECQKRGLAARFTAVDYSAEAIGFLAKSAPSIKGVVADISGAGFSLEGDFDVVIMSHVLEHLEEPSEFLKSLGRLRWRYLVAEVPLEDLLASRLKRVITSESPGKAAGHVQFFTAASFLTLLNDSGLAVVDYRRYVPINELQAIRFVCRKNGASRIKSMQVALTGYYLPRLAKHLWGKLYYAHYAALCTKERVS